MDHRDLLAVARTLGDAQSPPEYVAAVASELHRLIPADDVFWVSSDYWHRTSTVVRPDASLDRSLSDAVAQAVDHPVVASYVATRDLSPRRLSDAGAHRRDARGRAVDGLERELGAHQLSMVVEMAGLTGHAWILGRAARDFTDAEVDAAGWLLPLLTAYDRTNRYRPADGEVALTPREVEILALVARGLTAAAIGHGLGISARTVGKHLENAYAKLDRHDRLLAVERAVELGVVPDPHRRPRR